MRLGEIKQQIDRVISTSHTLVINNTPLYGEQAQEISNYGNLIEALETLVDFDWNDVTTEELNQITSVHKKSIRSVLPLADFNTLSSIVGRVNTKLPIYYSIIDTMVDSQDEKVINVKLPKKIETLDELSEFNKKLNTIFKSFQFDGQFKFQGFDKGTDWYEILITGTLFHTYFISCLKVAQEYYKAESEFFKAAKSEVDYLAAKACAGESDLDKETYKKNWLEAFIQAEVKKVYEETKQGNGKTDAEATSNLVIATKKLVEALGEGAEFHLSLNPPKYAEEQAGMLVIDYKKIRELKELEQPKQAQIEAPKKGS